MNLPTPEELRNKQSIEEQKNEILLRKTYEEWMTSQVIPNLTDKGTSGTCSQIIYKNFEKISEWLGEKDWEMTTWTTRESDWSMTGKDYYEYNVYNYRIYPKVK